MQSSMDFFPYDSNAVRCHPMSALLDSNQLVPSSLTIGSKMKLRFLCPVCNDVCIRTPTCTRNQTMMCKTHSRDLHYSKRPKYNGPIPLHVRRPIRAGLLLGVDRDQLCDIVTSLDPVNCEEIRGPRVSGNQLHRTHCPIRPCVFG